MKKTENTPINKELAVLKIVLNRLLTYAGSNHPLSRLLICSSGVLPAVATPSFAAHPLI